jgi:hypothetical protein
VNYRAAVKSNAKTTSNQQALPVAFLNNDSAPDFPDEEAEAEAEAFEVVAVSEEAKLDEPEPEAGISAVSDVKEAAVLPLVHEGGCDESNPETKFTVAHYPN